MKRIIIASVLMIAGIGALIWIKLPTPKMVEAVPITAPIDGDIRIDSGLEAVSAPLSAAPEMADAPKPWYEIIISMMKELLAMASTAVGLWMAILELKKKLKKRSPART